MANPTNPLQARDQEKQEPAKQPEKINDKPAPGVHRYRYNGTGKLHVRETPDPRGKSLLSGVKIKPGSEVEMTEAEAATHPPDRFTRIG